LLGNSTGYVFRFMPMPLGGPLPALAAEPLAIASTRADLRVVEDTIPQGGAHDVVPDDLAPRGDGRVSGQDQAFCVVPAADPRADAGGRRAVQRPLPHVLHEAPSRLPGRLQRARPVAARCGWTQVSRGVQEAEEPHGLALPPSALPRGVCPPRVAPESGRCPGGRRRPGWPAPGAGRGDPCGDAERTETDTVPVSVLRQIYPIIDRWNRSATWRALGAACRPASA
jgi:hypothetical protein